MFDLNFGNKSTPTTDGGRDRLSAMLCYENETFWDRHFIEDTNQPELSLCFQETVLVWFPCVLMWISTPFYVWLMSSESKGHHVQGLRRVSRSWLNILKLAVGILLALLDIVDIIIVCVTASSREMIAPLQGSIIRLITMILATILMTWEFRKGVFSSGFFFVFWLVYAICNSVTVYYYSSYAAYTYPYSDFHIVYSKARLASYSLILLEFVLSWFRDVKLLKLLNLYPLQEARNGGEENDQLIQRNHLIESPYRSAGFCSKLFFTWAWPGMFRGYRKGIKYEDITDTPPEEKSHALLDEFERSLADDLSNRPRSSKYFRCLMKSVAFLAIKSGFLRLFTILLLFVNLLVFRQMVQFIKSESSDIANVWEGYFYACVLLVVTGVRGLAAARWTYDCDVVGMHLRTIVTSTVYRKILKLSNSCSVESMDIGFVVNLMSVDSLRLSLSCRSIHEIVTLPIYVALAFVFLCFTISWQTALIGIAVMVFLVPLTTAIVAVINKRLQGRQMDAKDQRLKFMSEILAGIKVIKLYAWELIFEKRVTDIRNVELRSIKMAQFLSAVGNIMCLITPFLVSLALFGSSIALSIDHALNPATAFVALSLIFLINYNISTLPSSVQYVIQGFTALKRASNLMDQDEVQNDENRLLPIAGGPAIVVENGTFSWVGPQKLVLEKINVTIAPGKLVAVVGGVGSGKSSFLSCLLGEMKTHSGTVTISDQVAYLPQQAWILNGTVRDNICFQKPFRQSRFNKVTEACALRQDLENLPGAEMTEIGSKGTNLSGGQKQRVSIARAVYCNADTYLIDDSLSAVDPHVCKQIFQKAFGPRGVLRKKTRIFATNTYSFLPEVDRILVMKDGMIVEDGTYSELIKTGEEFRKLTAQTDSNDSASSSFLVRQQSSASMKRGKVSAVEALCHAWSQQNSFSGEPRIDRLSSVASMMELSLSDHHLGYDESNDVSDESMTNKYRVVVSDSPGTGFIKWHVVWTYIKAGGVGLFLLLVFGHCLFIGGQAAANVWLRMWTDCNFTATNVTQQYYLEIYGIFGIVQLVGIIINCLTFAFGFSRASFNLHFKALYRLFRAPISFFDTTPIGRILNYFSTDMDTVDSALPLDVILWLMSVSFLVSSIVTIGAANPIFLAIIIPIMLINVFVNRIYGANAIPLKRFYATKKSPVYSHFEETITGASSVRAYRRQQQFTDRCDMLTDESHRPWYTYVGCWRLYTVYNEMVGALAVFLTAATAVAIQADKTWPLKLTQGQLGLALFSVFQVLPHIPIASRMTVEIEANIVAVERIKQYSDDPVVPMESAWDVPEFRPRETWPENGAIEFKQFSVRHRPGLDLVLNGLSFKIKSKEKVGVVGRTGAGKSSIILSIFRMMEAADGCIEIDGEDISHLGLHDLRSKLTTIPQDPILFTGTLRSNLDPMNRHSDRQIWTALEQAHLRSYIESNMPQGLDEQVSNGDEISVGQRQLMCMARALLRNSKIIILDEATAGIDPFMDELIQQTIREQFVDSTVIAVAHRITTIMDYDRVMVLDRGNLMEMDSPSRLKENRSSIFASMAREAAQQKQTNEKRISPINDSTETALTADSDNGNGLFG